MKIIKSIKFFKSGSYSIELNKPVETREETIKFIEELRNLTKK
jgi:hypothetical protein